LSNLATVERLLTQYVAAFDAFDPEAIASFYNVPCMMIRAGEVATLSTRSAVLANMKALVALYRSQGYKRAFLDPGLALVTVPWTIYLLEAPATQVFRNTYEMLAHDGEWRIVVSSMHESGGVCPEAMRVRRNGRHRDG
jgi:hypothetical protein